MSEQAELVGQSITSTRNIPGCIIESLPQILVSVQNVAVLLSHQCTASLLQADVQLQTSSCPSQTEVCGVQVKFTALETA